MVFVLLIFALLSSYLVAYILCFCLVWDHRNSFWYLSSTFSCPVCLPHSVPHFPHLFYTSLSTWFSVFLSVSFLVLVHLPLFLVLALLPFSWPLPSFLCDLLCHHFHLFYWSSHMFTTVLYLRLLSSSRHLPTLPYRYLSVYKVFLQATFVQFRHPFTLLRYHPITLLRSAERRIVDIMKVYNERNNVHLDGVNISTLFTFTFPKWRCQCNIAHRLSTEDQDVSNTNQFDHCQFWMVIGDSKSPGIKSMLDTKRSQVPSSSRLCDLLLK